MRIVNRTEVPVVVDIGNGRVVVNACAERTLVLSGGAWGGDNAGRPPLEDAPPGAFVLELPGRAVTPQIEGRDDRAVMVTRDYIGYSFGGSEPQQIAGTGTFPPDPAAVECAGSPPPQPSASPAA